jgi:hypothetical protein
MQPGWLHNFGNCRFFFLSLRRIPLSTCEVRGKQSVLIGRLSPGYQPFRYDVFSLTNSRIIICKTNEKIFVTLSYWNSTICDKYSYGRK